MGTQVDFSLGLAVETIGYGVAATVTRFFESAVQWKWTPVKVQGKGMQPRKGVNRLNRNTLARIEASGEQNVEIASSGFGVLLQAVMGAVTNTVTKPSGTAFQQVHTLATTDPINSHTIQGVLPTLGGGVGNPQTFTGCVADAMTIDVKEGEILTAKIDWLARDMITDVPAAATSYPVTSLFTFVHGTIYRFLTTPPTATALATATGAPMANVSEFSLTIKNNLDKGGYNLGGAGKRSRRNELGVRSITGKIKAEFTDTQLRDLYVNQSATAFLLTFAQNLVIGQDAAGGIVNPTLQIALPAVLLKGDIPQSNDGQPISLDIDFEAFDDGTSAQPLWIVYRTTDTLP